MKNKLSKTKSVIFLILFTALVVTCYAQEIAVINNGIQLPLSLKRDTKKQSLITIDLTQAQTNFKKEALRYMLKRGVSDESGSSIEFYNREMNTQRRMPVKSESFHPITESNLISEIAKFNMNNSISGSYIEDIHLGKFNPRINISFTLLKITF